MEPETTETKRLMLWEWLHHKVEMSSCGSSAIARNHCLEDEVCYYINVSFRRISRATSWVWLANITYWLTKAA